MSIVDVVQDLRTAARGWRRRPVAAAAAVLTLAMGIGASLAVTSVVDDVLLQPLPYRDPSRLYLLNTVLPLADQVRPVSSGPELLAYSRSGAPFESLGGIWYRPGALTDDASDPEEVDMGFVTYGFLDALGVAPARGRWFLEEEDEPGGPRTIVLGHSLWSRRYGGDPTILGRRIELDGEPHTVVGVMPRDLRMLFPPDAAVPEHLDAWVPWGGRYDEYPATWRVMTLVVRLPEGDALAQTRQALTSAASDLALERASDYQGTGLGVRLEPLARASAAHLRERLLALMGAVVLVLAVACANVANLLMVKSVEAEREMAVRAALGAGGWRRFGHRIVETLAVTIPGAGLGVLFGSWLLSWLSSVRPPELSRVQDPGLSASLVVAALGFGIVLGFVLAAWNGLGLARRRSDAFLTLGAGARTRGGGRSARLRRALVAGEVALSLVLLVGAGLLMRSFVHLSRVEPGFDAGGVWTVKLSLVDGDFPYRAPEPIAALYRRLVRAVDELPGVESTGAVTQLPFDGASHSVVAYAPELGPDRTPVEWGSRVADYRTVTPGWFAAMGAAVVSGRTFRWTDDLDHPNVVVVDERLAERSWPRESALGKRLRVEYFREGDRRVEWAEVVGVVGHLRHHPAEVGMEQIFLAHAQSPQRTMALAVRAELPDETLASAVGDIVRSLHTGQPVHGARRFDDYFAAATASARFSTWLVAIFGVAAMALVAIGVYGVVAYAARQRRQEIGICLALGATPRRIRREVLRDGASLVLAGLLAGVVAAILLADALAGLLFGVGARDVTTYVVVSVLLASTGLLAALVPALRASRLDPTRALRDE